MEALWRAAAHRGGDYSSHLWVTILGMLHGTGLRRLSESEASVAYYFLAVSYEGLGRYQEAIQEYRKALELSEGDSDPTAGLGHAYPAGRYESWQTLPRLLRCLRRA